MSTASEGLKTTFELLAATDNEAAVRVLIPALDSPNARIREEALAAILRRRSPAGHREVLRRLPTVDQQAKDAVAECPTRMLQALREAVLGSDAQLSANAFEAAVWLRQYDLTAALIAVLEDKQNANRALAGKTLMQLADLLYSELADPQDEARRSNPQILRRRVVGELEKSVVRFGKHRRREILDAFVLLVPRDNATLKQILVDPHHPAFVVVVEALSKSTAGGVIRLLLSFLDDPHVPSVALLTISKRADRKFVEHLLRKVGREPSLVVRQNLKRITSLPWLESDLAMLEDLDEESQHAAVKLVMNSGVGRGLAFRVVEFLLLCGQTAGRRAAAEALREFTGSEANSVALRSLDDADPQVQAAILLQIRGRGIPGILPRLIEMVDSPHEVVREAARESLAEFTFKRFLGAFDMLDDEVRRSTGTLVKRIDPQTLPLLEAEFASQVRARRARALAIAQAIGAVPPTEISIIRMLGDDDHLVRAEAAAALAQATSQGSLDALREALGDRSSAVQEAARKSLLARSERSDRLASRFDPFDPRTTP